MKIAQRLFVMLGWLLFCSTANAAVVWLVEGGKLVGATGVDVAGVAYDVHFVDGITCAQVFGSCEPLHQFTFTTATGAQAASQALLDQVFIDGPAGNFDTDPFLPTGCSLVAGSNFRCFAITPYSISSDPLVTNNLLFSSVRNATVNSQDFVGLGSGPATVVNTAADPESVWAVWSLSSNAAAVPEPASLLLLGLGLAGLGFGRRKKA